MKLPSEIRMKEWILPAVGTSVFWGLHAFFPKLATGHIGPRSATVYLALGSLSVTVVILASLGFRPEVHPKAIVLTVIAGILVNVGNLCFLTALSEGPASLVAALTALYPGLVIVLAIIFLGAPIMPRQAVGETLSLVSMFLIAG
jgi:transporter family protein